MRFFGVPKFVNIHDGSDYKVLIAHNLIARYIIAVPNKKLPAGQALQLENQLCFALYSTSLAMTKMYTPMLKKMQLTYPQYLVLLVLWERDGLMVSEIAERLFLDSGTVTPLLKRMEATGLLIRLRDTEDERRVRVKLTAAGNGHRIKAAGIPECVSDKTGCSLSELLFINQEIKKLRQRLRGWSCSNPTDS